MWNGCALADRGVDPNQLEKALPEQGVSLRSLVARTRNSWHARKGEYDFSHEVKEAMSGCLACKACSTQCPIKIDVPEFRSRFLQLYTAAICGRCAIIWWPRSNLCAADGAGAEDL
ncbi:(Fe-S)-binding protein [Klebsiella pneumoniae subsp. pneumoniae]|nr:(Fe-S)-binding protein [Klebsiella pneumoniae subsp. pneumoniae]